MKKILVFVLLALLFVSCNQKNIIDSSDKDVVIGTFNIQWLGDGNDDNVKRSESDYMLIAEIIKETKADILGIQEIENTQALERLMKHLPEYNYKLGSNGWKLNLGVIYKKNIEITSEGEYLPLIVEKNRTRPGFFFTAKKGNFDWNMMVVHFKSTSRYDSTDEMRSRSYELRKLQSTQLNNWIDSLSNNTNEKDYIIVGDFNDNPAKKGKNLQILLDNGIDFLSADLTSCKNIMWTSIDHVAVNASAAKRYKVGSVMTHNFYNSLTKDQIDKVSDHCPVVAVFDTSVPDND